jgi:hypothetical protein
MDDLQLALKLLSGLDYLGGENLSDSTSPTEEEARLALVRLLESDEPLPHQLRIRLAAVFHPDAGRHPHVPYKVNLTRRKRGASAQTHKDLELYIEVIREMANSKARLSIEDACATVAERHGIEGETLEKKFSKANKASKLTDIFKERK